jgi:hypothetical protein
MPRQKDTLNVESHHAPNPLSHWQVIWDQGITTPEIEEWHHAGLGTEEDPYQVTWIPNDPRNPMEFKDSYKWLLVMVAAFTVLAVTLCSSAYSGSRFPNSIKNYYI